MRIGGQYVGLGSGDTSEEVRTIKAFMRKKFSYARSLSDTTLFDDATVAAVSEMQTRYRSAGKLLNYTLGVINAETKYVMGYLQRPRVDNRPALFTVCGTGVPWWVGPDADTARAVEDRYLWQPVGYPANPFPMGASVDAGRAELRNRMTLHRQRIQAHGAALIGYSQGAIVTSQCWEDDIEPAAGALHWAKPHLCKAVTFGNPWRQQDHAWPDPGGQTAGAGSHGIADRLLTDTPSWWRDYAHTGDLYSDCSGESAEDKTAIYKIVMGQKVFSGPDSILRQVFELLGIGDASRIIEITAMFKAIWDAGLFFARQTGPHVNYSPQAAIDYLRAG